MKQDVVARATTIAGTIVAISILIGSVMLFRVPHFEKTGALEFIETRSGSTYILKGEKQAK